MASMKVRAKMTGMKSALKKIEALSLTPKERRLYLSRIGRMAIAQAQKNVKDQKTVDGRPFAPRAPGHKKGPMLKKMVRTKWMKLKVEDFSSTIYFLRGVGYVAGKHQRGSDEIYRMNKAGKDFPKSLWYKFCNEKQAQALIGFGFQMTKTQIMRKVTVGDAINWINAHKESWRITVPARPFLGANADQQEAWGDMIVGSLRDKFRAKEHANLLT